MNDDLRGKRFEGILCRLDIGGVEVFRDGEFKEEGAKSTRAIKWWCERPLVVWCGREKEKGREIGEETAKAGR